MVISYHRNTTPNQSRNQRWMETLKQEQIPPAIIVETSLTGMSEHFCTNLIILWLDFEISSNLSGAKRKKSLSVINLAVGDKFPSFSLRRKSSSFLNLSGKESTTDVNDNSSNESEEENDSSSNPPMPPARTSSLEEPQTNQNSLKPIPAPRKISTVSLPGRLPRLRFRLCKFAFTFPAHHLTLLLFADPLLDQSFIQPGVPQLQYQMRRQQILSI